MDAIFSAFEISGIQTDARTAILASLGLLLIVMAVAYVSSVLFGSGHDGRVKDNDD